MYQERFLQVHQQQNEDEEKCGKETGDKGHSVLFALIFTDKSSLEESHVPKISGKVWNKEYLPEVEKNQVKEHLEKLDIHKSLGPGTMHLRLLRELADVTAGPLNSLWTVMAIRGSS